MSTAKKSRKPAGAGAFVPATIGKVVSLDKITLAPRTNSRGSIYAGAFEQMKGLKVGEAFTVDVPKGTEVRTMQNRISAARRRMKLEAPAGAVYFLSTSADGKVVIGCKKKPAK